VGGKELGNKAPKGPSGAPKAHCWAQTMKGWGGEKKKRAWGGSRGRVGRSTGPGQTTIEKSTVLPVAKPPDSGTRWIGRLRRKKNKEGKNTGGDMRG